MTETAKQTLEDPWLNYREAQEYSGGLSRGFLWQRIASGELRAYKAGRRVLIRRSDLDEFLSRRSAATTGED